MLLKLLRLLRLLRWPRMAKLALLQRLANVSVRSKVLLLLKLLLLELLLVLLLKLLMKLLLELLVLLFVKALLDTGHCHTAVEVVLLLMLLIILLTGARIRHLRSIHCCCAAAFNAFGRSTGTAAVFTSQSISSTQSNS